MMLKVLFHAYFHGLMSSRKNWDGLKERADFVFLSGDQVPDFRTINDFRTRHRKVLPKLFAQSGVINLRREDKGNFSATSIIRLSVAAVTSIVFSFPKTVEALVGVSAFPEID